MHRKLLSAINVGDDSPGRKPRGFSGSLRRLNPPSEGKDVKSSIHISIQLGATPATMPAFAEILFADSATAATPLAGIAGIHKQHRSTSVCSFVDTELLEHRPTSIDNTFIQSTFGSRSIRQVLPVFIRFRLRALAHVFGLQLLKDNQAISIDQLP